MMFFENSLSFLLLQYILIGLFSFMLLLFLFLRFIAIAINYQNIAYILFLTLILLIWFF